MENMELLGLKVGPVIQGAFIVLIIFLIIDLSIGIYKKVKANKKSENETH